MEIIVVDDEPIILEGESALLRRCAPEAKVTSFSSPQSALEYARANPVDAAFLDMEMPECHGVELARRLKALRPRMNIIFATAYRDFYEDAMRLRASGYLLKPLREEAVREELENLRYPPEERRPGLFVRTFGNFEVFWDGAPLRFRYQKTKELFAYLIDRKGALVGRDELVTVLWGGETERSNYYKQLKKDLNDLLRERGLEELLVSQRGAMGLLMDRIPCDYYDWLQGRPEGLNAYHGEYMRQYDWAEPTWLALEGKSSLWML